MRITPLLLVVPAALAIAGMVAGASWLLWPTPGWPSLPLGNSMTWLALVSLAGVILASAIAVIALPERRDKRPVQTS